MLYFTLREGDYFMVGEDVKVTFERTNGKASAFIGVDAPREVPVMRCQVYESEVAKLAASGDVQAQVLAGELANEREARKRKYTGRHNRSVYNEQKRAQKRTEQEAERVGNSNG